MAKRVLIETRMNSLGLKESVSEGESRKGCLGTLYGPCADYDKPTRNGNFYSRKLWENVFNDPLVKESLEDRILIGELDHPQDRLETQAVNACIVMTDYEFKDDESLVYGTFDILPTPNGRILKSLLDYGCKIGVSSRGEGDVLSDGDKDIVDEDGYNFVAFDAVVLPAVKAAKPCLREGLDREVKVNTLKESLMKEVESAKTVAELDLIKKVVESTNLPDSDSLIESVNNKSQELTEGTTSSSNLLEDLEKAIKHSEDLEKENKELSESVATCKGRLKKVIKSRAQLIRENDSLKESLKQVREDYTKSFEDQSASVKSQESLNESLEETRCEVRRLQEKLRATCSEISRGQSKINRLEESLRIRKEKEKSARGEMKSKLESLQSEKDDKVKAYESKLSESSQKISSLEKEKQSLLREYAKLKSQVSGVKLGTILESVNDKTTKSDIDRLVESIVDKSDRYRSVPVTQDSRLSSVKGVTLTENKVSQEDSTSLRFFKEAGKYF